MRVEADTVTAQGSRAPAAPRRRGGAGCAVLVCAALAACAMPPSPPSPPATPAEAPPGRAPAALAAAAAPAQAGDDQAGASLGIRITALRLSAGGFMVDLRYRLVDAERARRFFEGRRVIYLEDEASGARLAIPATPKLGALRPNSRAALKPGHEYAILFANPGAFVRPGARVRLIAGDVSVAALTVQ
jgi:hypothetical protein